MFKVAVPLRESALVSAFGCRVIYTLLAVTVLVAGMALSVRLVAVFIVALTMWANSLTSASRVGRCAGKRSSSSTKQLKKGLAHPGS